MPALAALLTLVTAGVGVDLRAQEAGEGQEDTGSREPPKLWIDPIGLVRAGLRVEPEDSPRNTGFDLFDARLGVQGGFGSILEYIVHAGLEPRAIDKEFEFLDVALAVTFMPELHFDVGLYARAALRRRPL
jgi:hypothetical protein